MTWGLHEDGTPWSVEDYLDNTTYAHDLLYVPSTFALSFVAFIKAVNGDQGEENKTPVVHLRMLDTLTQKGTNIINLCHRGIAKTTVMAEYLFLYIAVMEELPDMGKVNLALYVSDSIENGVKNMRKNLEFRWSNSDFLQKMLPPKRKEVVNGNAVWVDNVKFTDIRWEFGNVNGHTFIVKGYGAKTGVRGAKEMGMRPQLAVLDDLISDEDARSATVIAAVEDTVYKAVDYALHPTNSKIIWSGTPFNAKDPLYKAVGSGTWAVNVFPVCESFPVEKSQFRGSWPDRFTYKYVLDKYEKALKAGKIDTFNQELMLRIMSEEDRVILDSDIQWYRRDLVMKFRSNFNFYITSDWAMSETEKSDPSCINVWAYNNAGSWFWVDGINERQLMNKSMDDLFRFAAKYNPLGVGVEVTGQQSGFIPFIYDRQIEQNVFFPLVSEGNKNQPGIRPTTNKMERFNIAVPLFKSHKIHFPIEMKNHPLIVEYVNQLSLVSVGGFKSKHDDFLDNVSMLPLMKAFKPSEDSPIHQNSSGVWEDDEVESSPSALSSYIV